MEVEQIQKEISGEEAEDQPRYVVYSASYIFEPQPPIEWVIKDLITEGSVTMFFGEPGSKKTFALLSLSVCVALGKPWLGLNTAQKKVLVIDEESGNKRLTKRLAAAIRGELGDATIPLEFVSLAGFKLDSKKDAEELERLIMERGAGLVVIDALADVMTGDENSKQDVQPVFTTARRIAEHTNAAIIIIHHSGKNGTYRGSSAIKGSLDLMVKIESDNGSAFVAFKSEKERDIEKISLLAAAHWTEDQFYMTLADKTDKPRTRPKSQQYVIDFLKRNGEASVDAIKDNADKCSPEAARRAIYALADEKIIKRVNQGAKGQEAVYAMVETEAVEGEDGTDGDD